MSKSLFRTGLDFAATYIGGYYPGFSTQYDKFMKGYDEVKDTPVGGFIGDVVRGTLDSYDEKNNPYGRGDQGYQLPQMDTSLMDATRSGVSKQKVKASSVKTQKGKNPRIVQALKQLRQSQNKATKIQVAYIKPNLAPRTTINLK